MDFRVNLDAVTAEAVRMTGRLVRELGEEGALPCLLILREEMDRAIGECNFVVPVQPKKFAPRVIAGGRA